jgi:hypothetical protein
MNLAAGLRLGCLCLLLGAARASAQDDAIDPDRPDVTNGTHIVDVGLVQIEFGGIFTHSSDEGAFGSPITIRFGLTDWLEGRVGSDGLLTQMSGGTRVTGIGNVQLGAKLRLWADPGGVPVLSILPTINLPTANSEEGLGSGSADYTIAILTGRDIGKPGHVDFNYGIGRIGVGDGFARFTQHLVSVSASLAATVHWNPYLEAYWFSRQDIDGGAVTALDAGAIYALSPKFAIDGGVQLGLSRASPDIAAFGGISVIVGNPLGHGVHARQRRAARAGARHASR